MKPLIAIPIYKKQPHFLHAFHISRLLDFVTDKAIVEFSLQFVANALRIISHTCNGAIYLRCVLKIVIELGSDKQKFDIILHADSCNLNF